MRRTLLQKKAASTKILNINWMIATLGTALSIGLGTKNVEAVFTHALPADYIMLTSAFALIILVCTVIYHKSTDEIWDKKDRESVAHTATVYKIAGTVMLGMLGRGYGMMLTPLVCALLLAREKTKTLAVTGIAAVSTLMLTESGMPQEVVLCVAAAGLALFVLGTMNIEALILTTTASMYMQYITVVAMMAYACMYAKMIMPIYVAITFIVLGTNIYKHIKRWIYKVEMNTSIREWIYKRISKKTAKKLIATLMNMQKVLVALCISGYITICILTYMQQEGVIENIVDVMELKEGQRPVFFTV